MIDTLTLIATCIAACAATLIGYKANKIATNMAATSAHDMVSQALLDLTTGEVEDARDTIGSFRYAPESKVENISISELTRSYYRLTWAIERSSSALTSINESRWEKYAESAVNDQWSWHLKEISRNLDIITLVDSLKINDDVARSRRAQILKRLNIEYDEITKEDIDNGCRRAQLLQRQ
ncbi:hypothetical protein [Corynebacterium variabile]|uniref:Uncharacterized protein n=1 Tax=Corynebacterium variabile TaxID=1727 RepID=A0A4Y4C641_9CORY|nr:hypothetical protein [Corynebacterium variabile]GEC86590.1 hypothetical protein CVA01_19040 [Corynebacterium variabile]